MKQKVIFILVNEKFVLLIYKKNVVEDFNSKVKCKFKRK